jgi:hypothetical protein
MVYVGKPTEGGSATQKAQYMLVAVAQYVSKQDHSVCLTDLYLAIWLVREYCCVSQHGK